MLVYSLKTLDVVRGKLSRDTLSPCKKYFSEFWERYLLLPAFIAYWIHSERCSSCPDIRLAWKNIRMHNCVELPALPGEWPCFSRKC